MRNRRRSHRNAAEAGRIAAAISRNPREFVAIVMGTLAVGAIFVNALFLQHGPHPAPIFATRPVAASSSAVPAPVALPVPAPRSPAHIVEDIQRELARRGFYDGAADGVWGAKTDAAARDFVQAAGLKLNAEASETLLRAILASNARKAAANTAPVRNDPIAALIGPTPQLKAIQRALSDFGYGQIKADGVFDPETRAAIEKFERARHLPVTGQVSDRLVRELSAMTGRPLE